MNAQNILSDRMFFSGFYQRDAKFIGNFFDHTTEAMKRTAAYDANLAYTFQMAIDGLSPNGVCFTANGDDALGHFKIFGKIDKNQVEFQREYTRLLPAEIERQDILDFEGGIVSVCGRVIMAGTYRPREKRTNATGIWQLSHNPEGRIARIGFLEPKGRIIEPLTLEQI